MRDQLRLLKTEGVGKSGSATISGHALFVLYQCAIEVLHGLPDDPDFDTRVCCTKAEIEEFLAALRAEALHILRSP